MITRVIASLLAGAALSLGMQAAQAVDITGAGASLPYPVYAKWAAQYHRETGNRVNYQSIGSGGGQQQIIAKTVVFGASDDPMSFAELKKQGLLQFPAVAGGTVPVVNIDGIMPGQLRLTGKLLADIYLGVVTSWDDDAIVALNPDIALPSRSIVVVHRADGSGTTFGWTNYLSKVSPDWKARVGEGKAVKWPVGQGGKGNEGVAAYVRQLKDTIGYVEYAYAKQNGLSWTQLQNKDGEFVQPTQQAFSAAAESADWLGTPGMGVVLTNGPGPTAWPVTAASFILIPKVQIKPRQGRQALDFFDWVFKNGKEMAVELDYVPLPDAVVRQIQELWSSEIRTADGAVVWEPEQ